MGEGHAISGTLLTPVVGAKMEPDFEVMMPEAGKCLPRDNLMSSFPCKEQHVAFEQACLTREF
eukprot:snap_masked-scaffold_2-processed-gene-14.8-mRNA-1 protein AED:1.00 eAED:1.00 QI:0/-1/0/0/-1/1/1/0/62